MRIDLKDARFPACTTNRPRAKTRAAWGWEFYSLGMRNPVALGITHWILAQWGTVLVIVAYRRFLAPPVWYTIGLYVFTAAASYPIITLVMRSPFH